MSVFSLVTLSGATTLCKLKENCTGNKNISGYIKTYINEFIIINQTKMENNLNKK